MNLCSIRGQLRRSWLIFAVALTLSGGTLVVRAQELAPAPASTAVAPLPPVVARYEQMLASSPGKGTAFDKVYQHFFEGEGLDKLAARWQAKEMAGTPNAEVYALLSGLLNERRAKPDAARENYTRYTAAHPHDPRGWIALGELETAEGRPAASAAALAQALGADMQPPLPAATRPTVFRELARAQTRNFQAPAALETWRKLLQEFPDDASVLDEVGEAFQEAEAYDEAHATFEKRRELARKDGDAFGRVNATLRLGQIEEARGKAPAAVAIYEGVVSEAKAGSWLEREARARIEQLYRGQEDLPGLADYYKKWLADHPKDVEVATRRAAALIELNHKSEAIDLLKEATAWAPDRADLQVELALRLIETNRAAEAAGVMEKLTAAAPEERSYWQILGDARWQLMETTAAPAEKTKLRDSAISAWKNLAPAGSKEVALIGQLADLLASHRLNDEALAEYARAVAVAPDLPDTHERQADFLGQLGRKDEARAALAGVVAGPKNATAGNYLRLANALNRLEDAPAALEAANKGLELEPGNFDLLSLDWQLLTGAKRWDEAAALYDRLLAAAPNAYFAEQVQTRHVGVLVSANKLDATRQALLDRLEDNKAANAAAAPLSEAELALLARIDLQAAETSNGANNNAGASGSVARRALDEGRRRFPQSVALTRLGGEIAKRVQDTEGQIAALRRLIELQPAQKADCLREIARVYQDAGRAEEALAAANEMVAASPANVAGYLLLADLLLDGGRSEEGLQRLREAVKLSDKPNDIRQRLARAHLDLGQTAKAREVYEEAFENAANPQERLALMKPLTDVYNREGKIEELIERFQRRQQGETDGWRYALYLAEIYHEMLNYSASRRELTKALAARPKDGGLLRQLARVAAEEQNTAEVVRFQTLLAEAEPTAPNQLALVLALLDNNQSAEALSAIRRNLPALQKMAGAWDVLLPQLIAQDLVGKVSAMLTEAFGADQDGKSRFTLATFQASGGEFERAKETLWSIYQAAPGNPPPPPSAPPQPGTTSSRPQPSYYGSVFYGNSGGIRSQQRLMAAGRLRQSVQGWLVSAGRTSRSSSSSSFGAMPAGGNAASAALELADSSLVTLAAIAIKQDQVPQFLAEVEKRLQARGCSHAERLVTYAILDQHEPVLAELAALAAVPEPEEGFDRFCAQQLFTIAQYDSPGNRQYYGFPPLTKEQKDTVWQLFDKYVSRLSAKDASISATAWEAERYAMANSLERQDEARRSRRALTESAVQQPDEMLARLAYFFDESFTKDDVATIKTICQKLADPKAKPLGPNARNVTRYLPVQPLQQNSGARKLPPAELADLVADLFSLWYPAKAPPTALGGAGLTLPPYGLQPGEEQYLPPTRFIDVNDAQMLQQIASELQQVGGPDGPFMQRLRERLRQQAATLPPDRRLYPQLVQVYVDGYNQQYAPALQGAQALLAENENDEELRLLTGTLLGANHQYTEALALLAKVNFRYGVPAVIVNQQILTFAQAAKDKDAAKRAALVLAGLRLPPAQRDQVVLALQELGLKDKAEQLARGPVSSRGSSSSSNSNQIYTLYNRAQEAIDKKDEAAAISTAQALLALVDVNKVSGESDNVTAIEQVSSVYRQFHKRDQFMADLEKQVAQEPNSARLHYILATLNQDANINLNEEPAKDTKLPVWVKLTRNGKECTGYYSEDGVDWKPLGHANVDLGDKPLASLVITSCDEAKVGDAVIDNVELTPAPPTGAAGTTEQAAATDSPLPAPWMQQDIPPESPGADAVLHAPPSTFQNNAFTVHGAGANLYSTADSAHFTYRPLGEGTTFVARLVSYSNMVKDAKAGIMFRADLSPGSPAAAVVLKPTGRIGFRHRDGIDQSTPHWRKLVELRPKEMTFQLGLAARLAKNGAKTEALAIADQILSASPDEIFTGYDQNNRRQPIIGLYKDTGNFDRLVSRVLAWKPAPPNPNSPYLSSSEQFFQLLVGECAKQKKYEQAVALCRRGMELDTYSNGFNLRKSLYQNLLAMNRPDEARAAVLEVFAATPKAASGQPRAQLGFRSQVYYSNSNSPIWQRSVSYSMETGPDIYAMTLLTDARRQGWLPDLLAAAEEQAQKAPTDELQRQLVTLLRIRTHDPRAAADIAAQGAAAAPSQLVSRDTSTSVALLMYDAEDLKRWSGHEVLALDALRAARRLADTDRQGMATYYRPALLMREAEAEIQMGQLDAAAQTLHALSGTIKTQVIPGKANANSRSNNYFSKEIATACLELMLRAGAGAQADFIDLLATVRQDGRMDAIPFSYDLERDLYTGQAQRWQAYGWLLDDGAEEGGRRKAEGGGQKLDDAAAAGSKVVYEVRVEHPYDHKGVLTYPTTRSRAVDASARERTLIFSYSRTPEALTPIGRLTTNATHGVWTGPIPPGAGYLQVSIEGQPAAPATAAATPTPGKTGGDANSQPASQPTTDLPGMMRVVRSVNLIQNPGFAGLAERKPMPQPVPAQGNAPIVKPPAADENEEDDATANDDGPAQIAGWRGLPAGFWRLATEDGPLPGRGFITYEGAKQRQLQKIIGERIAIQPGRSYFQSAWFRDRVHDLPLKLGRRYLDANGNLLKETYADGYQTMIWRQHNQLLTPKPEKRDDLIPPGAAFIEPFIETRGGGDWTGLFLGEADASPEIAKTAAATSTP